MKPLQAAIGVMPDFTKFYAMCAKHGMSMEAAKALYEEERDVETWRNDLYVVSVYRLSNGITHLSIRRDDRKPTRDWRHFQQIKNQLCGDEREAVEIYPAESRVLDAANQYHLWVLPPGEVVPLGFATGGRSEFDDKELHGRQRSFKEEA